MGLLRLASNDSRVSGPFIVLSCKQYTPRLQLLQDFSKKHCLSENTLVANPCGQYAKQSRFNLDPKQSTQSTSYNSPEILRRDGNCFQLVSRYVNSELISSTDIRLLAMAPGSFTMGSPTSEVGHAFWEEQREVRVSHEFYLGATPVTQRQYKSLTGNNPTNHPGGNEDAPVDSVNWETAVAFCEQLTKLDRAAGTLNEDWEYRLPTETEWEYACRAGSAEATHGELNEVAWHAGNSNQTTHPVAQKNPNEWGFFDMYGNVWEMCQDWFWLKHNQRACRGGSYFNTERCCRAAARANYMGGRYTGFRLAAAPVGTVKLCPSIEDYSPTNSTPWIFDAFEANDLALAEQILKEHPHQLHDADGIPPSLHICIYSDLPEMLEWLLDHGANIEHPEQDYGSPPLNSAVVQRHQRIIRILVERGADTSRAMEFAKRGLAGEFAYDPTLDAEGYRVIVDLLEELGIT